MHALIHVNCFQFEFYWNKFSRFIYTQHFRCAAELMRSCYRDAYQPLQQRPNSPSTWKLFFRIKREIILEHNNAHTSIGPRTSEQHMDHDSFLINLSFRLSSIPNCYCCILICLSDCRWLMCTFVCVHSATHSLCTLHAVSVESIWTLSDSPLTAAYWMPVMNY